MSPPLNELLIQVALGGLIDRSWNKAGRDVEKFKQIIQEDGLVQGFLFEVGDVAIVDDAPSIDWTFLYLPPPPRITR